MLAHLTRNVTKNGMAILQFNLKLSIRQCLNDLALQFDYFF